MLLEGRRGARQRILEVKGRESVERPDTTESGRKSCVADRLAVARGCGEGLAEGECAGRIQPFEVGVGRHGAVDSEAAPAPTPPLLDPCLERLDRLEGRHRVRLVHDHRDSAGKGAPRARLPVLLVCLDSATEMHVHVDRSGQDHEPGAVKRLGRRPGGAGHPAVLDPEIDHAAIGQANVPEDQV